MHRGHWDCPFPSRPLLPGDYVQSCKASLHGNSLVANMVRTSRAIDAIRNDYARTQQLTTSICAGLPDPTLGRRHVSNTVTRPVARGQLFDTTAVLSGCLCSTRRQRPLPRQPVQGRHPATSTSSKTGSLTVRSTHPLSQGPRHSIAAATASDAVLRSQSAS